MQRKNEMLKFKTKIFKALADPFRLQMIEFLRDGEKCVCEITPHIKVLQPVASRHLKILKDIGLVKDRKDGNRRLYSLTDARILEAIDILTPDIVASISKQAIEQIV
jgi:ArsR family transcriptional regulator